MLATALLGATLLPACAGPRAIVETQEVHVPVPYRVTPPPALLAPVVTSERPRFVGPADTAATSCLTAQGERRLREMLIDLRLRIEMWEAWAQ